MQQTKAERLFSGSIGQEYDMLKVICPSAAKVCQRVGQALAEWVESGQLRLLEADALSALRNLTEA